MKPEMAAAPLEVRLKARFFTANRTHACSDAINHVPKHMSRSKTNEIACVEGLLSGSESFPVAMQRKPASRPS